MLIYFEYFILAQGHAKLCHVVLNMLQSFNLYHTNHFCPISPLTKLKFMTRSIHYFYRLNSIFVSLVSYLSYLSAAVFQISVSISFLEFLKVCPLAFSLFPSQCKLIGYRPNKICHMPKQIKTITSCSISQQGSLLRDFSFDEIGVVSIKIILNT